MLIFLTVVVGWPLAAVIRRVGGRTAQFAPAVRRARWLAFGVSILSPLFLVLVTVLTGVYPLQFGVPWGVKALLIVPLLTTALTAALPILGLRAWAESWSPLGRAQYALVTLAGVAYIWFLNYWNLLGFRL
jgi:hypothetical protein